jgi:predicted O-methyltransferase YrrM
MKKRIPYKGITPSQDPDYVRVFSKFLNEQKFTHIIEIGTYRGGMSLFLKDTSPNSKFVTVDIISYPSHEILKNNSVHIKIANIFNPDMSSVVDEEILQFLNEDGKKLILCDGGNKVKEFNCLSQYMKSGDFIMAHDYSKTKEYFLSNIKDKIWNHCEITEADISECSLRHTLRNYNEEEFQTVVWVCKRKDSIIPKNYHNPKDDGIKMECPWMVPSAVSFLVDRIGGHEVVLDAGMGGSTLFFARRCGMVFGLETNIDWFNKVEKALTDSGLNHRFSGRLLKTQSELLSEISNYSNFSFDIISIDTCGKETKRNELMREALPKLKPGGIVIQDNYALGNYLHMESIILNVLSNVGPYKIHDFDDVGWGGKGTRIFAPTL